MYTLTLPKELEDRLREEADKQGLNTRSKFPEFIRGKLWELSNE